MKTVYVVTGTCGEYSDRREWTVCVLPDEDAAKLFALRATEDSRRIYAEMGDSDRYNCDYRERVRAAASYDPYWDSDYTGPAEYHYGPAPFFDEVPASPAKQEGGG